MTFKRQGFSRVVVRAALAVALAAPAVGFQVRAVAQDPTGAAPVPARLLVPLRVSAPADVAVSDDGVVYAAEPTTGRVLAQHPDGAVTVLTFGGLAAPAAVAVAPDGTLYVAGGDQVRIVDSSGSQRDAGVAGLEEITALAVDPEDGSLLIADPATPQVVRVAADGTSQEVDLDGRGSFAGVAAGPVGDVLVIDQDAGDVAVLHPDGTSELAGLAPLDQATDVAQRDGTIAVAQPGAVVRRTGGTRSTTPAPIARSGGIALGPDGVAYATTAPDGTCRCPEGPGSVLRIGGEGHLSEVTFGDVASIPSVTATTPGVVVFSSTSGPMGYSDPNPLRQVQGDGPPEDLDVGGATGTLIAGAPDGTLYLSSGPTLTQVPPGGTPQPVDLPTEPGLDQVVDLAVDGAGRLFVALGSGYGTGPFLVVEPLAAGGAVTHHRGASDEILNAFAAGGGTIQLAISRVADGAQRLLRVPLDGSPVTEVGLGPAPASDLAVDDAGTAFLIELGEYSVLRRIPASGAPTEIAYEGQRTPGRVAVGTDGTLYVSDWEVGLLALDGVAATGAAQPATPPPAVPQSGSPSYTG